jgi:hypothetical protein
MIGIRADQVANAGLSNQRRIEQPIAMIGHKTATSHWHKGKIVLFQHFFVPA